MTRYLTILVPIFDRRCAVYIGNRRAAARAVLEQSPDTDLPGSNSDAWCSGALPDGSYILFLARWDGSPDAHGVLAHELFHLARHIVMDAGIDDADEAVAYVLGWLVRDALFKLQSP